LLSIVCSTMYFVEATIGLVIVILYSHLLWFWFCHSTVFCCHSII